MSTSREPAERTHAARRAELIRVRQERVRALEIDVANASGVGLEEARAELQLARQRLAEVEAGPKPAWKPPPPAKTHHLRRWWVGLAIGVTVLVGGVTSYHLTRDRGPDQSVIKTCNLVLEAGAYMIDGHEHYARTTSQEMLTAASHSSDSVLREAAEDVHAAWEFDDSALGRRSMRKFWSRCDELLGDGDGFADDGGEYGWG